MFPQVLPDLLRPADSFRFSSVSCQWHTSIASPCKWARKTGARQLWQHRSLFRAPERPGTSPPLGLTIYFDPSYLESSRGQRSPLKENYIFWKLVNETWFLFNLSFSNVIKLNSFCHKLLENGGLLVVFK